MSRRGKLSLGELRRIVLRGLDGEWCTATEVADRFGFGHGAGYLQVALVLERLANDGEAELQVRGRARRLRRAT